MRINYSQATIDIAEASGYKDCFTGYWDFDNQKYVPHWNSNQVFGTWKKTDMVAKLPNYFSDLNAINEAEKMVCGRIINAGKFLDHLVLVVGSKYFTHTDPKKMIEALGVFDVVSAASNERAEALLKALDKWTYEGHAERWSN